MAYKRKSPMPEIEGGTNQSTYAQGDLLYASAANTLSKLALGTESYILTAGATIPEWSVNTSAGKLLQTVYSQSSTAVACTGTINTTTPVYTSGTQILSVTITPTSASNYLLFTYKIAPLSTGTGANTNVQAIIVVDSSSVIATEVCSASNSDDTIVMGGTVIIQAPSTSALTYLLRGGPGTGACCATMTTPSSNHPAATRYNFLSVQEISL